MLLLPDAAVVLDQSQHMVMTVAADGTVVPKMVEIGDLSGGLRVIRSGLDAERPRRSSTDWCAPVPAPRSRPSDGVIHADAAPTADG